MAWEKGQSGNPAGREKGVPNKLTRDLKEMILEAANRAGDEDPVVLKDGTTVRGGVAYLMKRADDTPAAFMALLGKVLPMQVAGTDADGNAAPLSIAVTFIEPGQG